MKRSEKKLCIQNNIIAQDADRRQPVNILSLSRHFVYPQCMVNGDGIIMILYTQRFYISKRNRKKTKMVKLLVNWNANFSLHIFYSKKQHLRIITINVINRKRKWSTFFHLRMSDVRIHTFCPQLIFACGSA